MKNKVTIFRLLEVCRSQPQYGYVVSGIKKSELSDLAQHHFLVTFFAWQIARQVIGHGCRINVERILEISLLHDLGELFGGDISLPYGIANPKASKLAKEFEAENQRYIVRMLGDEGYYQPIFEEANRPNSVEGVIAKMADYLEVTHYKDYIGRMTVGDIRVIKQRLEVLITNLKDKKARAFLLKYLKEWSDEMQKIKKSELFEFAK